MRFRQIHLDFHTSEKIPGIGSKFDSKKFVDTLKSAYVDSITVFSKCHHGLSYHDTKIGQKHPQLKINLLDEMINACKKADINTPIYLSAGADLYQSYENPQWKEVTPEVSEGVCANLYPGFKKMCFGSPYLDYLCAQINEIMERYNGGDGIFTDIISQGECVCTYCLKGMEKAGLDPLISADRKKYALDVLENYYIRTTEAVRNKRNDCPVFHNSGHIKRGNRNKLKYFSHLELESLPTGGWGYDHFPTSAKYAATLGLEFLGMTGKFHTTWGEFGGFKTCTALKYECAAMIAMGAKCSIGDQLHPNGEIDPETYRIIGQAYKSVAEREDWCQGTTQISEIAILSTESCGNITSGRDNLSDTGAGRMLLEKHLLFDIIDDRADFNKYKVLILPDYGRLGSEIKDKVTDFIKSGGSIIASHESLLAADEDKFVVDLGAEYIGSSEWNPDYIVADKLSKGIVKSPFVMYERASKIKVKDCEILSKVEKPYFNRAFGHFSSHQHTPNEGQADYPAVVKKGNIIYFAHPIFKAYKNVGQQLYRDLFYNALLTVLKPMLEIDLPAIGRVSLTKQIEKNRYVMHVLFAYKEVRGESIEIIEDEVPLFNIRVKLDLKEKINSIKLEPQGEDIEYVQDKSSVNFTIPSVKLHQMIVLVV